MVEFPLSGRMSNSGKSNVWFIILVRYKKSLMHQKGVFVAIGVCLMFSCMKKNTDPNSLPATGYYGSWQYLGYSWGPPGLSPAYPDSTVVLQMDPGNNYRLTLNGQLVTQGTFEVDNSSGGPMVHFNNITQPYGADTSYVSGGIHFFGWNFVKAGGLTLFQYNWAQLPTDTLSMIQCCLLAPEVTMNYFKRL
jgi:hypothetical protein